MTLTKKESDWIEAATVARMELHQYILKLVGRKLRGREQKKLLDLVSKVANVNMKITEAVE